MTLKKFVPHILHLQPYGQMAKLYLGDMITMVVFVTWQMSSTMCSRLWDLTEHFTLYGQMAG